jgi:type II secretory pathway predicted ATPase ExeA
VIDSDHGQILPPPVEPTVPETAPNGRRESVFAALGLVANPFPHDPGAGPFIETASQISVLAALQEWWNTPTAGSLAIVTGPAGAGKTRLLLELRNVVADDNAALAILADPGARRSDAQLLKDAIAAFGAEPFARTGLELQGELRRHIARIASEGQRPLLLVDAANFAGSQLEILRSLLTDSPLRVVLFGEPDLTDRVARRRSLTGYIGYVGSIGALQADESVRLITERIATVSARGTALLDDDALESVATLATGNPGAVIRIMHTALLETIALGHQRIDRATILQSARALEEQPVHASDDDAEGDLVIQTRIELPGFEDVAPPPATRRRGGRARGGA